MSRTYYEMAFSFILTISPITLSLWVWCHCTNRLVILIREKNLWRNSWSIIGTSFNSLRTGKTSVLQSLFTISRRLIARCGAWELLIPPFYPSETKAHIACVEPTAFNSVRERVRQHRERFQLHTRAAKFFNGKNKKLKKIWQALIPSKVEGSA